MWRHRRRLWANGREDGIGKTMSPESASSARNRSGPDPRTTIRARGVYQPHHEAGHTSAPDHMLVAEVRFRLHPAGRPHTSGEYRLPLRRIVGQALWGMASLGQLSVHFSTSGH